MRPGGRLCVFLQLQSTVWVQAQSWIKPGVVLPDECNLTRGARGCRQASNYNDCPWSLSRSQDLRVARNRGGNGGSISGFLVGRGTNGVRVPAGESRKETRWY